jgi:hypothetical protein
VLPAAAGVSPAAGAKRPAEEPAAEPPAKKKEPHCFKPACKLCADSPSLFYFQPHPSRADNSPQFVNPSGESLYANSTDRVKKLYDEESWVFVTFGVTKRVHGADDADGLRIDFHERFKKEFSSTSLGYAVDESRAVLVAHPSACLNSYERSLKNLLSRASEFAGRANEEHKNRLRPKQKLKAAGVMSTSADASGLKTETVIVSPKVWKQIRGISGVEHQFMDALKKGDVKMNSTRQFLLTVISKAFKPPA